jgi:bacillithiol biosynthesis cysteine-adding enzyme BshC
MDSHLLKNSFLPILEKELIEQPSQKIVQATQEKLDKLGISSQAFPREINLFYLSEDSRKRIEQSGDEYFVVDSDVRWNKNEILDELHTYPERFSPNVLIRPLYQEFILPNLAYIGGGGEIAYWLERKEQFEHFGIPFPVLIRRNSAMLVPSYMQDQIQELGIADQQLFDEEDAIINNFLAGQTSVDIQLSEEMAQINQVFDKMADKAEQIDPPLSKWILAEGTKTHKIVEQIESRLKRAIKKKEENKVNQIRKIKNKLFPNNGLQERYDNFFQYYLTEGDSLIDGLISGFNPLENKFAIIYL